MFTRRLVWNKMIFFWLVESFSSRTFLFWGVKIPVSETLKFCALTDEVQSSRAKAAVKTYFRFIVSLIAAGFDSVCPLPVRLGPS